ncbi:MAG: hypothetical protein K6G22_06490 [Lachnospiraceae bacterium]|nr:hypothetical protein [Lachnospiraceae bacterium]
MSKRLEKTDLIQKLANEYGLEGKAIQQDSHYDYSTGTLFVGSKVYHKSDLDRALRFFMENKKKARSLNDAACELYEIGEVAVMQLIGICEENLGRIVLTEGAKPK